MTASTVPDQVFVSPDRSAKTGDGKQPALIRARMASGRVGFSSNYGRHAAAPARTVKNLSISQNPAATMTYMKYDDADLVNVGAELERGSGAATAASHRDARSGTDTTPRRGRCRGQAPAARGATVAPSCAR